MGAQDKLVPAAGIIINNEISTAWSSSGTYRMPGKKASKYKNPLIDANDFLASIHAKQLAIANNNHIWNGDMANTPPVYLSNQQLSAHALDRGIHDEILPGFSVTSIGEWNELQTAISRSYNIVVRPVLGTANGYSANEFAESVIRIGIFSLTTGNLLDALGNLLGVYPLGPDYANAWNSVKVPADAVLGFQTNYIAPIYPTTLGPFFAYYRYTGKSRWAYPFTGWDLLK